MPNFNSQKTAIITAIVAMFCTFYSIKFDLVDLAIPFSWSLVIFKIISAMTPVTWFYFFRKINLDKKIFYCSLAWATYSILCTYHLAVNYWIAAVQISLVYTSVLFIDRIQFIISYVYITIGTSLALAYSPSLHGFGKFGAADKAIIIDDFLTLQLLTGLVYAIVTYPRIKKLKEDLRFSNFGKASSFILHEMQKPLSRMSAEGVMHDEIESLRKTLNIAKQLQSGSLDNIKISQIEIGPFCQNIINKYQEFLDYYQIKLNYNFDSKTFKSDTIMLSHVLDNLIRNAIEANKDVEQNKRWINFVSINNHLIISNPYTTMIDEADLFTPLKSSKEGNMGAGLHFCKTITAGLGHSLKAKCKNNIFEIRVDF